MDEEQRDEQMPEDELVSAEEAVEAIEKKTNFDWQVTKSNVQDRLEHLCLSELRSDVTFVVGIEGETVNFSAHRLVLSMSSAVFDALFFSQLAVEDSVVRLDDLDPEGFKVMLTYIYTDRIELRTDNVMYVLYAAKKYALLVLERACLTFVRNNVTADTVLHFYHLVNVFSFHFCYSLPLFAS
jgi:hypothetical protein